MSYINPKDKLPSGNYGWFIHSDTIGELSISFHNGNYYEYFNPTHTKEDVIVIRDILNKALANWDKGSGCCEYCKHFLRKNDPIETRRLRKDDKYCGDFHNGTVGSCQNMKWK